MCLCQYRLDLKRMKTQNHHAKEESRLPWSSWQCQGKLLSPPQTHMQLSQAQLRQGDAAQCAHC